MSLTSNPTKDRRLAIWIKKLERVEQEIADLEGNEIEEEREIELDNEWHRIVCKIKELKGW